MNAATSWACPLAWFSNRVRRRRLSRCSERVRKFSRIADRPPADLDTTPFGLEANRRNLEVAIDYVHAQRLIPRRFTVDELFDDVTRRLS